MHARPTKDAAAEARPVCVIRYASVLEALGHVAPTPVQKDVWPLIDAAEHVVAIAPTGTITSNLCHVP